MTQVSEPRPKGDLRFEFVSPRAWGQILRTMRKEHDLTQGELAMLIGTSQSFVSHVEQGKTFPGDLSRWAKAFGVSLADLTCRLSGVTNVTERTIQADPLLSVEQKTALLVIYGSFTGRDSAVIASAIAETNEWPQAEIDSP